MQKRQPDCHEKEKTKVPRRVVGCRPKTGIRNGEGGQVVGVEGLARACVCMLAAHLPPGVLQVSMVTAPGMSKGMAWLLNTRHSLLPCTIRCWIRGFCVHAAESRRAGPQHLHSVRAPTPEGPQPTVWLPGAPPRPRSWLM